MNSQSKKARNVFALLGTAALALGSTVQAAAPKESPELIAKGKKSFEMSCAMCHGNNGDPDTSVAGKALNPKPRNLAKDTFKSGDTVEKIFEVVSKGLPGTAMMAFGHIPEEDRWGISYYIVSMRKK